MVNRLLFLALVAFSFAHAVETPAVAPTPGRERLRLDTGWRFAFGNPADRARDFEHGTGYFSDEAKAGYGDGPAAATFDDRGWRVLDLPHDWAVEAPFSPNASPSHGFKAVGPGFPERSVGWYRRSFSIPNSDLGRRVSLEFDGVFRNSVVWVNGFRLGVHASGYSGFRYDVTDYLNYGGENAVVVRVDASKEEGWFYEGAGIYRHVWLVKTAPLHVVQWGTEIRTTTQVSDGVAHVTVHTTVANEGAAQAEFSLEQVVLDPEGQVAGRETYERFMVPPGSANAFPSEVQVNRPRLWSPESPALYRLVTTLRSGGREVDRFETPFGIRTVVFDPDRGFFLNGQRVELKGVNLHQDCAGVGVATPDALNAFRIARVKTFGANAIRCAHNPPSAEFLDACDRLGMLVIDENRLMGSNPAQLEELEAMMVRDRNHPSVILWSLGNEEWAIEGNIKGARIATTMQARARQIDPTRRLTFANSGGWGGISSVADVIGYNYISQTNPDKQHAEYPRQPGVGTEETTTQGTRGIYFDEPANAYLSPQEKGDSGGNCEKGWKYYAERPFLAGLFFWTGFDYRGEPTPFGWPAISSQFGLLDACGFPKDSSYYLKAWWTDEPVLHLSPHWNWAGREGQEIKVVCFSNHEAVELFLNGTSLGRKDNPRNGHLEWRVPYAPGALEARGYRGGRVFQATRVDTTGVAARLVLTPDRNHINADGADVAVFSVAAVDAQGRVVPTAGDRVRFEVTGGRIIGVGNGNPSSHEPDQFVEAVSQVGVENWQGRIAPAGTTAPGAPELLKPMRELGRWKAPVPTESERYDLAGEFRLESVDASTRRTLFLPSFGAKTSVWINGQLAAADLDTTATGPEVALDPARLIAGVNHVQLIVEPVSDRRSHIPESTRVGVVKLVTAAPPAERALFNGYAQVLVQSAAVPGVIQVRAAAPGLVAAEATVDAR